MAKKYHKYHEQKVLGDRYGRDLQGLGDHALVKQRGLRGIKLGPANQGRTLSPKEREAVEQQMRKDGTL